MSSICLVASAPVSVDPAARHRVDSDLARQLVDVDLDLIETLCSQRQPHGPFQAIDAAPPSW
jgi:hypothetical protein